MPSIGFAFDRANPFASAWAKAHAAELVTHVAEEARLSIREVMLRVFAENIPPDEAAELVRPLIGLLPTHADAVLRLRSSLQQNAGRVVWAGEKRILVPASGATRAFVAAQLSAYADRLLSFRASMIARTETLGASNEGQRQIGRASCRERVKSQCRSRWSPYH